MIRYHAAWILPITSNPIRNGWVDVEEGRIRAVGGPGQRDSALAPKREVHLLTRAILPGLVNAHTHLELSDLSGCVPPATAMPIWAQALMAAAAKRPPDRCAIRAAAEEARQAGTALVGDISNTLASVEPLAETEMAAVVFFELLGFDQQNGTGAVTRAVRELESHLASGVRLSLAAHAPYSVSPQLFTALRTAVKSGYAGPLTVHVAESSEEVEFLQAGTGPWRELLEERRRWNSNWTPPGGVIDYLSGLGWLNSDTLLVHGVHLTAVELEQLVAAGSTLVTCPRSNRCTGAGVPALDQFFSCGAKVAIGTDSLASVDNLNLFAEISEIRRLAPSVPASAILQSATRIGATALGFGDELGAVVPGHRAALIAVELPGAVDDVEEWLLSGIQPDQIAWLTDASDW